MGSNPRDSSNTRFTEVPSEDKYNGVAQNSD